MVYGKLALPPVRFGAKVKTVDDGEAKKVPGFVKAVVVDDKTGTTSGWVVAVASTYEDAKKAAAALKIDWDHGPNAKVSDQSIIDESRRMQKGRHRRHLLRQGRRLRCRDGDSRQSDRGGISHQP